MTTENSTTTSVPDVTNNLTTTASATTEGQTYPITSSVPTTLQTNSTSMVYPRETTKPTSNTGLAVGLGIGLSAVVIMVLVIAVIAWRRKRNRKKENRQTPNLPTASEVDRVIIAESKKEKKKKKFKMPKLSFTNTAHENELSSSTTLPDYVNVKNKKKKDPFYANTDTKVVEQPEYIEPLPDNKTIYTGAESGVTYYMDNNTPNTATPRPTVRTGNRQQEVVQDDYEEVNPLNKKTKNTGNIGDRADPTLLGKDYVNVSNMKKPR